LTNKRERRTICSKPTKEARSTTNQLGVGINQENEMKAFTRKEITFKARQPGFIMDRSEMAKRRTKNYGEFSKVVLIMFRKGELK